MVLGCKECAYENSKGGPARLTLEQFLERSKVIHNNFYSYDKIDFTNKTAKQKVTITCPLHGDFEQEIYSHTKGVGCKECGIKKYAASRAATLKETWEEDFRKVHGNTYDYSQVNYINRDTKVNIICPIHGVFKQVPQSHLQRIWL